MEVKLGQVAIVIPLIFGLVIFLGVLGNLAVLLIIAVNVHMRNSTNYLGPLLPSLPSLPLHVRRPRCSGEPGLLQPPLRHLLRPLHGLHLRHQELALRPLVVQRTGLPCPHPQPSHAQPSQRPVQGMAYAQHISVYASVWTLALLALDRFLAVVFPIPSRGYRTPWKTGIALGLTWLACLAVALPVWPRFGVVAYELGPGEARSTCIHQAPLHSPTH